MINITKNITVAVFFENLMFCLLLFIWLTILIFNYLSFLFAVLFSFVFLLEFCKELKGITVIIGLLVICRFMLTKNSPGQVFCKPKFRRVFSVIAIWMLQIFLGLFPHLFAFNEERVYVFSTPCFSCVPDWKHQKMFSIVWVSLSFYLDDLKYKE